MSSFVILLISEGNKLLIAILASIPLGDIMYLLVRFQRALLRKFLPAMAYELFCFVVLCFFV